MTLREAAAILAAHGIDSADYDARLLAAHCTGYSDARLLGMRDTPIDADAFPELIRRRAAREPLQYILGEWTFMGLDFFVSPDCLIPRADTEVLVEEALRCLPPNAHAADLCTGSGCIGISLACLRPDIRITAVDLYEPAACMAERNAARHLVSDRFRVLRGDVTDRCLPPQEQYPLIVSNPPYIAFNEMEALAPELAFEPRTALTDEGDGLRVIRGVLNTARHHLTADGILLMEFGASQGNIIRALAEEYGFLPEILRDFGGNDRVLRAVRKTI